MQPRPAGDRRITAPITTASPPGHRIRLRISGGAARTLVPVDPPVDVTVHTGPASTLSLPLVVPEGVSAPSAR